MRTYQDILNRAKYLEENGFDYIDLGLQFVIHSNPKLPFFNGWSLCSAIAALTTHLRIIMGVNPIPYLNPAFCARKTLTVDHISNGRFELGLSAGVPGNPDHEMTSISDWSPRERVARFREYVEIVDQLLRNEVTTYNGRYYKIKGAVMNPRPIQKPRPPIWIAAHGPKMLKYAARYADTWNSGSVLPTYAEKLEDMRSKYDIVDGYCRENGRDPDSLRRSFILFEGEAVSNFGLFKVYESGEAFKEIIETFIDIGISNNRNIHRYWYIGVFTILAN
jgi:alkanesulfonate monooxygenase SsuD/methylene tetrahydromethanopterin reductase-like flavin-dependent oxidoreductase (luciferase family)